MIDENGRSSMLSLKGFDYIHKFREYLDYLEEHFKNIEKAFEEVVKALDGTSIIGDDCAYWGLLHADVQKHDLSKFSALEFIAYRNMFYPLDDEIKDKDSFDKAWENHKAMNKHHWESITNEAEGKDGLVERNIIHMIIDWTAMGYKFGDTAHEYYMSNHEKIDIPNKYIPFLEDTFKRINDTKDAQALNKA